jgi:hypothetical protein
MDLLVRHVLAEADLDGDDALTYAEFEHVMAKAPDFVQSFRSIHRRMAWGVRKDRRRPQADRPTSGPPLIRP